MDGLQTKQTRWFSLRESECSKHGTGYILQGCRITARVDQDMLDGRVPAWLDGRHLAGTMKEEEEWIKKELAASQWRVREEPLWIMAIARLGASASVSDTTIFTCSIDLQSYNNHRSPYPKPR
jgi:hypothetical protein